MMIMNEAATVQGVTTMRPMRWTCGIAWRRRETGRLAPAPHRGGRRRLPRPAGRCRLRDLVEEHRHDTVDVLGEDGA